MTQGLGLPGISTGFPELDALIQGTTPSGTPGFPKGRITQIIAPPGTGLSSFALRTLLPACREYAPRRILLLDWAGAFSTTPLRGVDHVAPPTIEDATEMVFAHLQTDGGPVFMYYPDLAVSKKEGVASAAAAWTDALPRLKKLLDNAKPPVIAFTQDKKDPVVWKFYASLRIRLAPIDVGWEAYIIKSKVSNAQGRKAEIEQEVGGVK